MKLSKGRIKSAMKILIYGPEGIGKSTFASRFPAPVFIDTEGSTKALDVLRVDPAPASWPELIGCVREFTAKREELGESLGTLVIDTADWAEKLCRENVCAARKMKSIEDAGYGKGYTYVEEAFGELLRALDAVIAKGVHVVVTAHAQMRKFEQPDELGAYDRWELKMSKRTAALLKEWADAVLFANYKTQVVNVDNQGALKGKNKAQGGARVLYTSHHPCWDAKNRFGLPDELPLDYDAFARWTSSLSPEERPAESETIPPEAGGTSSLSSEGRPAESEGVAPVGTSSIPPNEGAGDEAPANEAGGGAALDKGMRALLQLMERDVVNEVELRRAVAMQGFYPEETPIAQYDPEFISGMLVADWAGVLDVVQQMRGNDEIPF